MDSKSRYKIASYFVADTLAPIGNLKVSMDEDFVIVLENENDQSVYDLKLIEPSFELKALVAGLLGKEIMLQDDNFHLNEELLFTNSDVKEFIENVTVCGASLYMSKDNVYYIRESKNSIKLSNLNVDNISYLMLNASFISSDELQFNLGVLFNKNELTYVDRTINFFNGLRGIAIKPTGSIGPIISTKDLDLLYNAIRPYDPVVPYTPEIRNGTVYLLEGLDRVENTLILKIVDTDTGKRHSFNIRCYSSNVAYNLRNRSISKVYEYFSNYVGYYFVSGEDISNNMLDYMRVPSPEEPFIFYFTKVGNLNEDKELLRNHSLQYHNRWNNIITIGFNFKLNKKTYLRVE